ncbi:50S ribosomal protein L35 [Bacteriovoracaceae bacterium]|nr:50S ribosomal protein L35 [Bacteriovoracaceae bacterium]
MPKMKTKRAALKRFKVTANGKIKFKKAGLRHILTKQSTDSKRKKRLGDYVKSGDMKRVLRCLPNGSY